MRHYCTLFDSKYLPQGLALYDSLVRHTDHLRDGMRLWVLAMDAECWHTLKAMALPYVEVIDLHAFEWDMNLRECRGNRTWREYCWTCASQLCEYLLRDGLPEVTYVDADVFIMANPGPVFEQIGSRSIAITPHQFPDNSEKLRLQKSGLFNVGFVHFKNTPSGRWCCSQWAAQVRNRCSADVGCGDQCYLDSWVADFGSEVCVLGVGVNMGPWNLMAYDVKERDGSIYLDEHPLIAFHFHEYVHGERLTNYPLRPQDIALLYAPYSAANEAAKQRIAEVGAHI